MRKFWKIFGGHIRNPMRSRNGILLLALPVLLLACRSGNKESDVAARVGNAVLLRSTIDRRMAIEGYKPDQVSDYIERWVNRELLSQEARRLGFNRSEGLDLELEAVEKEFLIQKLLEAAFAERIQVSDDEITAVYEKDKDFFAALTDEVRLLHILTETRDEANLAYREIQTGKPFEDVARTRSIDVFHEQGGDMGFVRADQLSPEVAQVAFRLQKGGLSSVFSTSQGYHILKVSDKRSKGDIKPLSEVKDEVRDRVRIGKERNVYFDLLYQLQNRNKVYVAQSYRAPEGVPDTTRSGGESGDEAE